MKEYLINNKIRSNKIRIVNSSDKSVIVTFAQALLEARQQNLDLVEISKSDDISICQIVDWGKFKFDLNKQTKRTTVKTKELQFKLGIAEHDYGVKLQHMKEFLQDGNKVKIMIKFRGRQNAHPELGFKLVERIITDIDSVGKVDFALKLSGKTINLQLSPK